MRLKVRLWTDVSSFPPGSWRKLTTWKMQSESGIVPDFEVGEEFHEEPKTYYELKSQPLKNRSVNYAERVSYFCFWQLWCELAFLYCTRYKVDKDHNLWFLLYFLDLYLLFFWFVLYLRREQSFYFNQRVAAACSVDCSFIILSALKLLASRCLQPRWVLQLDNALGYNIILKYLLTHLYVC